jgi:hypothetical protein
MPDMLPVMILLMASYSRMFAPAFVLLAVVLLGALEARLGVIGSMILAAAIVGLPGVTYKKFPLFVGALGLPLEWRTKVVIVQTLMGAAACVLLQVPAPVSATVVGLAAGNSALAVARFKLNASAHVSVLTFAVLWGIAVFGPLCAYLLVLVPIMLVSRTTLREHSWGEGFAGLVVGGAAFACFVGADNLDLLL